MLPWESPTYFLLRVFGALLQWSGGAVLIAQIVIWSSRDGWPSLEAWLVFLIPGDTSAQILFMAALTIALGTVCKGIAFVMEEVASAPEQLSKPFQ